MVASQLQHATNHSAVLSHMTIDDISVIPTEHWEFSYLINDNVSWTIVVVSLVVARSRSANLPKWDRKRNSPSTMCAIVMLGNVILKEYILSPPPPPSIHPSNYSTLCRIRNTLRIS